MSLKILDRLGGVLNCIPWQWWVRWQNSTEEEKGIYVARLSGLELAKYVLLRLVYDHDSIEKIAVAFDDDKKFILGVVYFLMDIGWVKQDLSGTYRITKKGKMNTISQPTWR